MDDSKNTRKSFIFVPTSSRGVNVNLKIMSRLPGLHRDGLVDLLLLSVRSRKNGEREVERFKKNSVVGRYCFENGLGVIPVEPSYDHAHASLRLNDSSVNRTVYVARYNESDVDTFVSYLQSLGISTEKIIA